jgi:hypothetical protein
MTGMQQATIVRVEATRISDPHLPLARPAGTGPPPAQTGQPAYRRTDPLAVSSAVCGITAIVPVLCQIAGLGLGIASLVRIRRARRDGSVLRGRGLAWVGIATSALALVSWIAVATMLAAVGNSLSDTTEALQVIATPH